MIMAAGAVMFVFSFLPFYSVSGGGQSLEWSSWSNAFSLVPLVPLMVLLGAAMAIRVALERFGTLRVPERVTIYTWGQLETVLSILIALTILCYIIRDLSGVDKGVGAWFLFIGSVGLVVGQLLLEHDRAAASSAG